VGDTRISVRDRIQGEIAQDLCTEVGDFVLHRADGIHAYQLAVVVDDEAQGITHIVRGADLMQSTPRQVYLQRRLGLRTPDYAHVPLALDPEGRKLSKSLAAAPVDPRDPMPGLLRAWRFLGQTQPSAPPGSVAAFWDHAIAAWRIDRVPRAHALPALDALR
jgi:glutamyl-Q tRNA(Asp) synthetase